MRIIAGKFKGHRLVPFQADHIRPTTDRVKESLFNKWMSLCEGARVLDLFSGTGNLGLEALSRGAEYVEFVEKNDKSLRILRENLAKLRVKEGVKVIKMDVLQYLKQKGDRFDLILIDPPFTQVMADQVLSQLASSSVLGPGTLVAIESGTKEHVEEVYGALRLYDHKEFGDKTLNLYENLFERTAD